MNTHSQDSTKHIQRLSERGQSMVLIALMMIALVGMLALVLDGGFAYAARRAAQNAADAGALAGANVLCGIHEGDARQTAWDYTVIHNNAVDADITIGNSVQVTATMVHDSFFAGIIGHDVVTVTAFAEAGCYNPCVAAILPIAWACRPPDDATYDEYDVNSCEIHYGTINDLGPLYVIMDTPKVEEDYLCQDPPNSGTPAGALDCDMDNDGEDDLMTGGGRSWLDLTGVGGGSAELRDYISGDVILYLPEHIWLLPNLGNKVTAFQEAVNRIGDIVSLPVFNDYSEACNPHPFEPDWCDTKWHAGVDTIPNQTFDGDWYHIISFSLFKVTGVWVNGSCKLNDSGEGTCPATIFLQTQGVLRANDNTIEGYFIEGYEEGMSGKCTNNTGAITIYLDH